MRVERHPKLNIWVREDGCVYVPQSGSRKAHWTYGCPNSRSYLQVRIAGKSYKVHRLVVETFIQFPIPEGMEIDHISRDKSSNMLSNLRIVSRSDNQRNTSRHDRVTERGGTHKYEDSKQYARENAARSYQAKRKTHRQVRFSDGSKHMIPLKEADAYLIIPLKERHYGK